jgi:hypothetical protein
MYDQPGTELQGANVSSNLELTSGYHQIRMKALDVENPAFDSSLGLFQFKVLPFGCVMHPGCKAGRGHLSNSHGIC